MPRSGRSGYKLYTKLWAALDLIYPPICGGCGQRGKRWCASCQVQTKLITAPICNLCGRPQDREGVCSLCISSQPVITGIRSWAVYEDPLRNAIHRLKYYRDISLGEILSRQLIGCIKNVQWVVDMIVPVPLGRSRLKERGYNQAALLAYPLALNTGIVYRPKVLHRVLETKTQVGLSFEQRKQNVAGAFSAESENVVNRRILLIDDIATSGATLDACARGLLMAGATDIYGLTLARAL